MHAIQQMCSCIGRTTPVVFRFPMREPLAHFARMDRSPLPYKLQNQLCPLPIHPGDTVIGAGMHQFLNSTGDEPIVDEEIFVDIELLVLTFEVACTIVFYSMAQDQVLRPCR